MDLHLVFLLMVWVAISLLNGTFRTRHVPVWPLLVLFLCWLAILLVRGMSVGGDFVAALWELRGFFYFGIMIAFVPQIVWTKEQLHVLLWVCIGAMGFRACLGASRFILSGFSMAGYDTFLSHEDPLFIVTLLVFLGALVLFEVRTRQKVVLALLLPPLLLGFYSGNRRAAYASLAVSVVAFMSLLPRKESIRFWKALAPVLVVAVMYAVVFWTSDSKLATPLKQLKSGFEDDSELTERNYWSNLYRKIEDYNLAATIQRSPIVGIGFGTKYDQPLVLVEIAFSLRDYMAHNNVLWLFAKTGIVGFFLFWFLMNGYAVKAAGLVARLQDPYAKAVVVLILVAIINQMSAAYFDLHLVRYRTMIYLGVLMGLLPVLVTEVDGKLHKGVLHAA